MTNPSRKDLAGLVSQLRPEAERLPPDEREVALQHVQEVEQHAEANTLHTVRAKSVLKALEIFEPFVPILARIANALASVGM